MHLLKRAFYAYGDARFERLASLSVSHLYNLRHSKTYQNQRVSFTKTRPVVNPIGIRRAPHPEGRPGFIRIDSVHHGDLDGTKGVYHVNAVDIVTQWEVVVTQADKGVDFDFLRPGIMRERISRDRSKEQD